MELSSGLATFFTLTHNIHLIKYELCQSKHFIEKVSKWGLFERRNLISWNINQL